MRVRRSCCSRFGRGNEGQVLNHFLGVLGLAGTTFACAEDGLVLAVLHHRPVCRVRDGENVRWHLMALLALVRLDDRLRVDGQLLVRIDHNAEQTRVRLQI